MLIHLVTIFNPVMRVIERNWKHLESSWLLCSAPLPLETRELLLLVYFVTFVFLLMLEFFQEVSWFYN